MKGKLMMPKMDWQQVVLNGGPPCFAVLDDKPEYYCGRAERWEGHDGDHEFVSLESLMQSATTTRPDFTPHPFVGIPAGELGLSTCERCGLQERDITHSLKFQLPPSLTEQARQLVEQWLNEPSVRIFIRFTKDDQQSEMLRNAIASFAAEAATAALEQAAQIAESVPGTDISEKVLGVAALIARRIHALKPIGDDKE